VSQKSKTTSTLYCC